MPKNKFRGFTLVEMLLVLVVISFIIRMGMNYLERYSAEARLDRTSVEMQQILSAGMVYHMSKNAWPKEETGNALEHLQGKAAGDPKLIPIALDSDGKPIAAGTYPTPWSGIGGGASYIVRNSGGVLYVGVQLPIRNDIASVSKQLQSRLPMAVTTTADFKTVTLPASSLGCDETSNACWVIASVNAPAQSLSNAGNIQFANLYRHGACVPAPICPTDPATGAALVPQIFVVPVGVAGQNTAGRDNPLYTFTAYASQGSPQANTEGTPALCLNSGAKPTSPSGSSCGDPTSNFAEAPSKLYWRVCLQVKTDDGIVSSDNAGWGNTIQLLAITRCQPMKEKVGSGFNVWGR